LFPDRILSITAMNLHHPLAALAALTFCLTSHSASAADAPAAKGWLLVTNKTDQTLSIVDPVTNKQVATIPEGGNTGHELAASPDGKRAFVPIYSDAGIGKPGTDGQLIRVMDVDKREVVSTIDFGHGVRPHCAVYCEKNGLLYVTTELENSVSVIDPATLKIVGAVPTGKPESHMLAVTRDGKRGYTANVSTGTVSVLDLEGKKLVTTIPVSGKTQRISLSVDDRWAFTADQTKSQLVVIDTKTNEVAQRIELPDFGFGTAATPDGKTLLVCCGLGEVAVIDLEAKKVVRTLQLPRAPQEILIRPDGAVAYVSCDASAKIGVIDLKEWKVSALIEVGKNADGLAWAVVK
jgi:YVTN family beta-propeller protein